MIDWMICTLKDDKTTKLCYPSKEWKIVSSEKKMRPREEVTEWLTNKTQLLKNCIDNNILPTPEPSGLCDLSNRTQTSYCETRHLCPVWAPDFET
jgi:hypothetical protein